MAIVTETQVAPPNPEDLSVCARWASIAIREQLVEIQKGIKALVTFPIHHSKRPVMLIMSIA